MPQIGLWERQGFYFEDSGVLRYIQEYAKELKKLGYYTRINVWTPDGVPSNVHADLYIKRKLIKKKRSR